MLLVVIVLLRKNEVRDFHVVVVQQWQGNECDACQKVVVWQLKHCFCDVFVTVAVVLAKGLLKLLQGNLLNLFGYC